MWEWLSHLCNDQPHVLVFAGHRDPRPIDNAIILDSALSGTHITASVNKPVDALYSAETAGPSAPDAKLVQLGA